MSTLWWSRHTQAWVQKQLGKLLPVTYFMVTFTLPTPLRAVMRGNRPAIELFMQCSSQALTELLVDPARCGFHRSGFFGVYQSWTQDMRFHPHVHYVVPAAGLDSQWRLKRLKSEKFLIHADALAMRLRTLLANKLREAALIDLTLFWRLVKTKWNASVDRAGTGENAIKYLGQYIRRSVISDARILAIEGDNVRIRTKNRDEDTYTSCVIPGVEFVRRFLQHALPPGFHRIRYRGFQHARGKEALQWLQLLLNASVLAKPAPPPIPATERICPHCGARMFKTQRMPRAPPKQRNVHFFRCVAA